MPELPEVEVTARALDACLAGHAVRRVSVLQPRLRWPVPGDLGATLSGCTLEGVGRRGKYLLWRFKHGTMISHLGMSGSWRVLEGAAPPARLVHDHVELLVGSAIARFHDPRRFGALLWHPAGDGDVCAHPLLTRLGIEPFDPAFDAEMLYQATRGSRRAIKSVLLAGDVVVGVGNIYASECLFSARIHPQTAAGAIQRQGFERLVAAIRRILAQAIDLGGSSLRDFTRIDGVDGNFTEVASVYGRAGLPCPVCGSAVRRLVQGQRATYFCPRCQRARKATPGRAGL